MRCQEEPSGTSVAIFTSTGCAPTGAAETIIAASATKATRTVPRRHVFIEPIGPPSPSFHEQFVDTAQQPARALLIHEVRETHVGRGVGVDGERLAEQALELAAVLPRHPHRPRAIHERGYPPSAPQRRPARWVIARAREGSTR